MSETSRILSLPSFQWPLALDLSARLKTPDGTWTLRPVQNQALHAMACARGLLGPVGVGFGKTLISCLAGTVLGVPPDKVVLLLPAPLAKTFDKELETYRRHWRVTPPQVRRYSMLSRVSGLDMLTELAPELLILDECHYVRNAQSARTRRLLRYLRANPATMVVALSGTMTSRSVKDYAHLAKHALGAGSPLPRAYSTLESWAAVLDHSHETPCAMDWTAISPLVKKYTGLPVWDVPHKQAVARRCFHKRLTTAPGVVHTLRSSCNATLAVSVLSCPPAPLVRKGLEGLADWTLPDGQPLLTTLDMARARRQLAQGFYYSWGVGADLPAEWMHVRAEWHRALVRFLKYSGSKGIDTPCQVVSRLSEGPEWLKEAWQAWQAIKDTFTPVTRATWLSDRLVSKVATLAKKSPRPVLVWYSDRAIAHALAEQGLDVVWPGQEVGPVRTCAVSIASHGTGQNLQGWSDNLILSLPASASRVEQLLGRTHRPGQTADTVRVSVFRQTSNLAAVREGARYLHQTTGQEQKILLASIDSAEGAG